ncbi:hypothetical protein Trco_001120 [Trichoderma cornu-damae]|uniref:Uncharacterized protein n=1 Tax=Trichoderma cornu-damae TaxID=654480 RepID=A0A9P8QWQ3_9HYPO|nr:hypothetical protein Trco_001120 [Trichoderma cornu-damae]
MWYKVPGRKRLWAKAYGTVLWTDSHAMVQFRYQRVRAERRACAPYNDLTLRTNEARADFGVPCVEPRARPSSVRFGIASWS